MTYVTRDEIESVISGSGLDGEVEIYEDYSGRAMYGETCFGIVCREPAFAMFCAGAGATLDSWEWIERVRTDSMGLSIIWYWPGVKLEEAEDDEPSRS